MPITFLYSRYISLYILLPPLVTSSLPSHNIPPAPPLVTSPLPPSRGELQSGINQSGVLDI